MVRYMDGNADNEKSDETSSFLNTANGTRPTYVECRAAMGGARNSVRWATSEQKLTPALLQKTKVRACVTEQCFFSYRSSVILPGGWREMQGWVGVFQSHAVAYLSGGLLVLKFVCRGKQQRG